MTDNWSAQLTAGGFNLSTTTAPTELPSTFCAVARNYCLLSVQGPDTEKFLQGQLTCDLKDLTETRSIPGAACNPKGRAYALFQLAKMAEDHVLLRVPAAIADDVVAHLQKYLAFFKAEMTREDDWIVLGTVGGDVGEDSPGSVRPVKGGLSITLHSSSDGVPRHEYWLNMNRLEQLPEITFPKASSAAWHRALIESGLVTLSPEIAGAFVPQNLNLHAIAGISFRKGCYTGQEVVARMHYLGKLKKSLFRLQITGATRTPAIGDSVSDENGKSLGSIVDRVTDTSGTTHALAVLSHQVLATTPRLTEQPEAAVSLEPLGYEVPDQTAEVAADHKA